jgi:DNA invertase Pin-like site-specific DNA recombinase
MPYNGIALVRVSTEEQAAEGRAGVLRQKEDNRLTAINCRVNLVRTFEIVDVSGTELFRTREFEEILECLNDPQIQGLVIPAIDRLVRPDDFSAFSIFEFFLRNHKLIWTPSGPIDVTEDSGFLQVIVQSMMAGLDRRRILRNTWMGKEENRKRKRCANSKITLPQGVDFDFRTGVWSWVEPYASRMKLAYKLLLAGNASVWSIAAALGYPCKRTLYNQLRNPIWIGIREYRDRRGDVKYRSQNGHQSDRKKVPRPEPLRVRIEIEPLIPEEDFAEAQRILDAIKTGWTSARSTESRFEVSGLLYCARCGKRMYSRGDKRPGKHDIYYCKSRFPAGKGCGASTLRRERKPDA